MSNDSFERQAKADLRRAVAGTSPETRARLEEIVTRAVRESAERAPQPRSRWWLSLPLAGGSVAAAVAVLLWSPAESPPRPAGSQADDLALLLNVDNLDLLEGMEFYQWLEREPGLLEVEAGHSTQRQPT
jgi:hypothetical protein